MKIYEIPMRSSFTPTVMKPKVQCDLNLKNKYELSIKGVFHMTLKKTNLNYI